MRDFLSIIIALTILFITNPTNNNPITHTGRSKDAKATSKNTK